MEQTILAVYATDEFSLRSQISSALDTVVDRTPESENPIGLLVPASNSLQGGCISAAAYAALSGRDYETVVVVSAADSERFRKMAICKPERCESPLGLVPLNIEMREELCDEDDDIFIDDTGHFGETGLRVQLPFLQVLLDNFKILPVVMGDESLPFCKELGHAVGEVIYGRRSLVVACFDILWATEAALIELREAINSFDIDALVSLFARDDEIEVHGAGPLLVMMMATGRRRASKANVLCVQIPGEAGPGSMAGVVFAS